MSQVRWWLVEECGGVSWPLRMLLLSTGIQMIGGNWSRKMAMKSECNGGPKGLNFSLEAQTLSAGPSVKPKLLKILAFKM